jgi:hypothetical protein
MPENRSTFSQAVKPSDYYFAAVGETYKKHDAAWRQWMTTRSSKDAYETAFYYSGFGYVPEKPEGAPFQLDERYEGPEKRWLHKTYALGCRQTQEGKEDDNFGIMVKAMRDLGTAAAITQHLLATRMLMNAAATTYHAGADALAMCVNNHPILGGGTWSNVAAAAAPTEATLTAAIQAYELITGPRGRGKKFMRKAKAIICGPSLDFTFKKLLESPLEPGTANNAINPIMGMGLKLIVDPFITDDRWFIMGDKDPDIGPIHFDRVKTAVSEHGDPDNGDSIYVLRFRESNEFASAENLYLVPAT